MVESEMVGRAPGTWWHHSPTCGHIWARPASLLAHHVEVVRMLRAPASHTAGSREWARHLSSRLPDRLRGLAEGQAAQPAQWCRWRCVLSRVHRGCTAPMQWNRAAVWQGPRRPWPHDSSAGAVQAKPLRTDLSWYAQGMTGVGSGVSNSKLLAVLAKARTWVKAQLQLLCLMESGGSFFYASCGGGFMQLITFRSL